MHRELAPSLVLCLLLLCYLGTQESTAVLKTMDSKALRVHQSKQVLQEKHTYLQRVKELLDVVADSYNTSIDSKTFVRRLAVKGVVAELLSAGDSPVRTAMPYTRGNQLLQAGADGSFKVIVTVDPPFKGEQCFLAKGFVDYSELSGVMTSILPVSCKERPKVWSNPRPSEWTAAGAKPSQYSNGSKGNGLHFIC